MPITFLTSPYLPFDCITFFTCLSYSLVRPTWRLIFLWRFPCFPVFFFFFIYFLSYVVYFQYHYLFYFLSTCLAVYLLVYLSVCMYPLFPFSLSLSLSTISFSRLPCPCVSFQVLHHLVCDSCSHTGRGSCSPASFPSLASLPLGGVLAAVWRPLTPGGSCV